jgi:uncharacterized protein YpmS
MSEEMENPKKSNGAFITIIILLLLGLGYMAYLISDKKSQLNNCSNKNLALEADMKGMNEMMSGYLGSMSSDLKTDFKNMLQTYDALLADSSG